MDTAAEHHNAGAGGQPPPLIPLPVYHRAAHYGPVAFGVIALVVVWQAIVSPELRAQREREATTTKETVGAIRSLTEAVTALRLEWRAAHAAQEAAR